MQISQLEETTNTQALLSFIGVMFRANTRHLQTLVLNLGTPLAIASMFLLTQQRVSASVVPLLFLVSIVFAGATLGTRIIVWRDQKIFRRLAVTSMPLDVIVFGLFVAQLAVSITQSVILLMIIILLGVSFTLAQLIVSIWAIILACFCFTAFGPILATIIKRADMMSYAYLFVAMPMTFISGLLGTATFQQPVTTIIELLPTTMLVKLLTIIQIPISIESFLLNSIGLLLYGFIFLYVIRIRSQTLIN